MSLGACLARTRGNHTRCKSLRMGESSAASHRTVVDAGHIAGYHVSFNEHTIMGSLTRHMRSQLRLRVPLPETGR